MNGTSPEPLDGGKGSKKLARLRHINPERAARAIRTAEIKNIHVRTGSFVQASKYFDDLIERVNAGITACLGPHPLAGRSCKSFDRLPGDGRALSFDRALGPLSVGMGLIADGLQL